MSKVKAPDEKLHAGNPHVRFDEGEVAPCTAEASLRRVHCRRQPEGRASVCAATPSRGSLLYKTDIHDEPIAKIKSILLITLGVCAVSSFAAVDGTRLQSLRDAGIVDADTIAYLPLDTLDSSSKGDYALDNYAYGSNAREALLNIKEAGAVSVANSVFGSDKAIRHGWTNENSAVNGASFQFKQQGSTNGRSGSVYLSDIDHTIMSESFTFEAFYRWDSQPTATHYFLSQHTKTEANANEVALRGQLNANGTLTISALNGTYDAESGELVSSVLVRGGTSYPCVDGKWHHVAIVYDKEARTFKSYVDYRNIVDVAGFTAVTNAAKSYSNAFIIGDGYYTNSDYANTDGGLDEVRITRRALSVNEFLFPERYVDTDTIAWVSFEGGDLGLWPYSCARQPSSTNSVITFSDDTIGGVGIRTKGKTPLRAGNTKSLSITSGMRPLIEYLNDPLVNGSTFNAATIEFFAKGTDAYSYGLMAAIVGAADSDSFTNNVMAVRIPNQSTADNVGYYQGHFYDSENNQRAGLYKNPDKPQNVTTDGDWHHIAATFQQVGNKVVHTAYYDYKKVAELTVPEYAAQHSYLRANLVHSVLQIGHGITGCIDEVRLSKGTLPVESFLCRDRGVKGFIMIFH